MRGLPEAEAAAVEDVTRYVLATVPRVSLNATESRPARVSADGAIEVELACPETLAGQRLVAEFAAFAGVRVADGRADVSGIDARVAEEIRCPLPGEPRARLALRGLPSGLEVHHTPPGGYLSPPKRIETGELHVPPGAKLRLAIGLASLQPAERRAAARFIVRSVDDTGKAVVLLDRVLDPARRHHERGWVTVSIELDRARSASGTLNLVFEAQNVEADQLAFPVWGDPTIVVPATPTPARRPSVVLVSLDTLRADHLGCYGFPQPTSPNLDRLAMQGTLFEQAIAHSTLTLPSHATLLTGVLPCVHGLFLARGPQRIPRGIVPLAEILRGAGYATAAFTEDAMVSPGVFQRGFEVFRADTSLAEGGVTGGVEATVQGALEWLAANGTDDFFLFVHTYQVHAPYTPPPGYLERLTPGTRVARGPAPSAEAAADAARYAAEVRYTDEVLGRLIDALDVRDLAERTILIVTSDHGEAFGEHGDRYHGGFWEEQIHVPLIWRAPGRIAAGRRVPHLVGLVDVVPTILDLLGTAAPPPVQGLSLRSLMSEGHAEHGERWKRALLIEGLAAQRALRGPTWKVIDAKPASRFFLLSPDGHEQEASPEPAFVAESRVAALETCARSRAAVAAVAATPTKADPTREADADRERKLRALGYVD
jgi:arylsulfatase A-like enzyme